MKFRYGKIWVLGFGLLAWIIHINLKIASVCG